MRMAHQFGVFIWLIGALIYVANASDTCFPLLAIQVNPLCVNDNSCPVGQCRIGMEVATSQLHFTFDRVYLSIPRTLIFFLSLNLLDGQVLYPKCDDVYSRSLVRTYNCSDYLCMKQV